MKLTRKRLMEMAGINTKPLLIENQQAKDLFIDIMTAAQRQGKFEEVAQMLDDKYGVWFTDDPNISQKDLYTAINRADFSAMTSQDLSALTKEVEQLVRLRESNVEKKDLSEKLSFILGPTIHGDPDKPMDTDFRIGFKDTRSALMKLMKISDELEARGLDPLDFDHVGFVINKPTHNQMNAIIDAFNNSDIEHIGRY